MCGIAGIISTNPTLERVKTMTHLLVHRGPDEYGLFTENVPTLNLEITLGHRRLSIRDLTRAASQPMTDPSKRWTLVYNGEIYNCDEIKRELAKSGVTSFQGHGDTEVLLKAWTVWQEETPKHLQGEFAFAIWDAQEKKLFLVRDRLGIKPLYYTHSGGDFGFSSELHALNRVELTSSAIEPQALDSYLAFGSVSEPWTLFQNTFVVPAASIGVFELTQQRFITHRYWENPFFLPPTQKLDEIDLTGLEALARDTVNCRLVSDVPLGIFLSGGIDSGSIVSAAAKTSQRSPHTFHIDVPNLAFSEGRFATEVANYFGTSHQTLTLTDQKFSESLDRAFDAFDQPSIDGINSYFVCQLAKQAGITVALSGVGGDELFAGYPLFRKVSSLNYFRKIPERLRRLALSFQSTVNQFEKTGKASALLASDLDLLSVYGIKRSVFLEGHRKEILAMPSAQKSSRNWIESLLPANFSNPDLINVLSGLEIEHYLRNTLLRDLDVMSMANSLEVRGPFLDHRLVEKLASLPGTAKLSREMNKPLLASTLGKDLPQNCLHREKKGFQLPFKHWLRSTLDQSIQIAFSPKNAPRWQDLGLNPTAVMQVYSAFQQKKPSAQWQHVWALYNLYRWRE